MASFAEIFPSSSSLVTGILSAIPASITETLSSIQAIRPETPSSFPAAAAPDTLTSSQADATKILSSFSSSITGILSVLPRSISENLFTLPASSTETLFPLQAFTTETSPSILTLTIEYLSSAPSSTNPISGLPSLPEFEKLLKMADLAHAIAIIGVLFSVICLLMAGLRLVVRYVRENMAWDDYLMFTGAVCFCFNNAIAIVASLSGIGVENFEINWEEPLQGSKWIIYWGFTYAISTVPIKASLCFSLFRISDALKTRVTAYGLTGLTVAAASAQILWVALACRPFSYLWDEVSQRGTCIHIEITVISIYLFAAVCIFVDVGVALSVYPLLRDLQMPWSRKMMTWGIYTLGVLASVATIARIFFIPAYLGMGYWTPGFYYKLGGVVITSQVEIGLAIMGGCLPSTRQGIRLVNWRFWKKLNGRYRFIKPQKLAVTLPRSVCNRPLVSPSRLALPITIMAPDIITASPPTDASGMSTASSPSSIPPVPLVPERYLSAIAPFADPIASVIPESSTTPGHVRSPSKTLGVTTVITGGLTQEEKKSRKRKSKQSKKKVCSECGKRNCDEHSDVLDPLNPPLDGIIVTKTVETTVTYDTEGVYGYGPGVSGLNTRGSFSTSVEIGPSTTTARPVSRGPRSTSGPRGPRYRPKETPKEDGTPLDTLTSEGRLATVPDENEEITHADDKNVLDV